MASTQQPLDFAPYAVASARLQALVSLLSIVGLIFGIRQGSRRKPLVVAPTEEQQKAGDAAEAPARPGGSGCLLLLLLAELIGQHEIFKGAAPKSGKAGSKQAAFAPGSPLGALLSRITSAQKTATSDMTPVTRMTTFLMEVLTDAEAFGAVHGIVMIVAAGVAACAYASESVTGPPTARSEKSPARSGLSPAVLFALALPLGIFACFNAEALGKVWRQTVGEGIPPPLCLLLRCGALLAASSASTGGGGSPASFIMLQIAALLLPIMDGGLQAALPFIQGRQPWPPLSADSLFDSVWLWRLAATVSTAVCVSVKHFWPNVDYVLLPLLITGTCNPITLARIWPMVASSVGLPGAALDNLLRGVSILYAMSSLMLFISGGPLVLLCCVMLAQALAQAHGPETLAKAFGSM
eukprot:TRINITY_DN101747_c0_g1_i1.p1 TRINITY_DN101747_c0_g1~~TRINITY_DN101747_c0_g1_i1.p1  ORF type:complete len:410 (+),score=48.16 TRINITY_DN101747_c0_g1_i1:49-1278(+)